GELAIGKHRIGGLRETVQLVETGDLLFVGEQDVGSFADEAQKVGAVAIDAKGVRQSEGNLGAGFSRKPRRLLEGLLRLLAVEQIAFEIDDARRLDERRIDVGGREVHARAEKRVHGALAVRGHKDEATGGWLALIGWRRVVGDAERADVVAENAAELIGSD